MLLFIWAIISTIMVFPYVRCHWQDEVQIVEIARGGITEKIEPWSMVATEDCRADSQSWAIYYIGGLLFEQMYQVAGHLGPRALAMTAYLLFVALLGWYLYKKTGHGLLCAILALLVLSFPVLQVSARGVRADIPSMLFAVASMAILQLDVHGGRKQFLIFAISGSLYALALFSWISAGLMAPLVGWEMLETVKRNNWSNRKVISILFISVLGFGVTSFIILSPFFVDWRGAIEGFRTAWEINTSDSYRAGKLLFGDFLKCLIQFPGLYLLGLGILFTRRRFLVLSCGVLSFSLIILMTRVYPSRFVYFIPYACVGLAIGVSMLKCTWMKMVLYVIVSLMMLMAYGRTYILRNYTDYVYRDYRDYSRIAPIVESKIGRGVNAYVDTYELYYIGRELGWNQWHCLRRGQRPTDRLMKKLDCCILRRGVVETEGLVEIMQRHGFIKSEVIEMPLARSQNLFCPLPWILSRCEAFIGPFEVYRRRKDIKQ